MGPTECGLVADLIDWIEGPSSGQGRPRCPTEAMVEALRCFLREGVQWRELRATGDLVCGATLRRRTEWSTAALLHPVPDFSRTGRQLYSPSLSSASSAASAHRRDFEQRR